MTGIPNWPVLQTLWGAPYNANGGQPTGYNGGGLSGQNVDISNRILTSLGIKVGKQYELDQAQAGELDTTLRNDDAVLDPTNASSPFAGHIAPYQPFSVQAQYPPSANLLTYFQATGGAGYSTGTMPTNQNVYSGTDSTGGSIVAQSASPNDTAFNFAVPATYGEGEFIMAFTNTPCEPNQEYTFSTNVMNTMSGVTGPVQIAFGWYGPAFSFGPASWSYGPTVNLTADTWYAISATATAPDWACGCGVGLVTGGTPTAAWNVEVYDSQFQAGGLSAYQNPGVWYPMFAGWVERWPTSWKQGGQYGTIGATVVDAMALLSQGQLSDPLTEEIDYAGNNFLYPLNDDSSGSQANEANGKFPALNITSVGTGGTLTFGNDIEAASPTGIFTAGGVDPTVVDITPGTAGTDYLSLSNVGIYGPQSVNFTRMIAFRWEGTVTAASQAIWLWNAADNSEVNFCGMLLLSQGTSNSAGAQLGFYLEASGLLYTPTNGVNLLDGNWHLVGFGNNSAGNTILFVDGQYSSNTTSTFSVPPNIVNDQIGYIGPNNTPTYASLYFNGQIAYAAEFNVMLTSTQVTEIYGAWLNACAGESSSARYSRILRYAKYAGPTAIGSGCLTTDMGPATDLDGSDALTCLENVVTSENGTHYVSASGTLTFTGRGFRYNRTTPIYTFGEDTAAGEWAYEDLQLDYDTTHLANDITITNNYTSQNYYSINQASMTAYFDRTMTRTINVNSAQECQDCAAFMGWRYGQPLTRVNSITLNPAAQANLWPVALSVEINDCIQVNRRPPGCPEISLLMWVENKQWTVDDKGNAKLILQCSPAIPTNMGQFTTWHTTLSVQANSGQPTITVVPPTADTVNPLNAYISPGMQLIVGWSGAVPETMTVLSVQATGSNWTTGTITFTANLVHTHTAGFYVTEYIPSTQTTLGVYDANSKFDDTAFSY